MPSRKRTHDDAMTETPAKPPSMLSRVRNCWAFAALYSFIYIFGDALKIDREVDIDLLEEECLKPEPSQKLAELGLLLLKHVSSHRGLTLDLFDEYTRRQYQAKAPTRNIYGDEEEPKHFNEFDVFTKLKVLHQLAVWTLYNPDKIREKMNQRDYQQANWRIEYDGEDAQGRKYYVLDDNRLYRWTDAPLPPLPPKVKAKPKPKPAPKPPAGRRQSKRQKLMREEEENEDEEMEDVGDTSEITTQQAEEKTHSGDNADLEGADWECLAITLDEYNAVLASFKGTRDADEKALVSRIRDKALPAIEAAFEAQARKAAARARELATLEKMAYAKRSSRISARAEKEREAQAVAEQEKKHKEELAMAHKEQQRLLKIEQERESRMQTREQRLKEREMRRVLHEEELAKLERASEDVENQEGRLSERNRQLQLQKKKEELDKINQETEDWDFDCSVCGVHGKNIDDGSHSLQCEKCDVWQHSKCHGLTPTQAEAEDFHFVCASCRRPKKPAVVKQEHEVNDSPAVLNGDKVVNGETGPPAKVVTPKKPRKKTTTPSKSPKTKISLPHAQGNGQTSVSPQKSSDTQSNGHGAKTTGTVTAKTSSNPPSSMQAMFQAKEYRPPQQQFKPSAAPHRQGLPSPRLGQQSATRPPATQIQQDDPFIGPPAKGVSLPFSSPSKLASAPSDHPPHLNATQGNTDVRFSPNHGTARHPSQSYSPTSNRPAAAALSPTKQPSPPHNHRRPSFGSTSFGGGAAIVGDHSSTPGRHHQQYPPTNSFSSQPSFSGTSSQPSIVPPSPSTFNPVPAQRSPIPPAVAGLSPSKSSPSQSQASHDQVSNANLGATSQQQPSFSSSTLSFPSAAATTTTAEAATAATPSKISLPPALALSPSVNAGPLNLAPPTKKPTPEKSAPPLPHAAPAGPAAASPLVTTNGVLPRQPPPPQPAFVASPAGPPVPDKVRLVNGSIVGGGGAAASAAAAKSQIDARR